MKKIIFILAIVIGFVSCQKDEIIKKKQQSQSIEKTAQNDVSIFLFFEHQSISGTLDLYKGQQLDSTIDLETLSVSDTTLFDTTHVLNYVQVSLEYSDQEILDVNGWFHISAQFDNNYTIYNVNEHNGSMTFVNNNTDFLEPSHKFVDSSNVLYNSFWINTNNISPTLEYEEYDRNLSKF